MLVAINKHSNFAIWFFNNIAKPKNIANPVVECPDGNERTGNNTTFVTGFSTIDGSFAKYVEGRGKSVIVFINSTNKNDTSRLIPILKKVEFRCNKAMMSSIAIPMPPSRFVEILKYSLKKPVWFWLKNNNNSSLLFERKKIKPVKNNIK